MGSPTGGTVLAVIEENNDHRNSLVETNNTKHENSVNTVTFEEGNVCLEIPQRTDSGGYSYASQGSKGGLKSSFRRSAKWFRSKHVDDASGHSNAAETPPRSRCNSGASNVTRNENRFHRKKSVMQGIMKRGRTMRKRVQALHIHEAEEGDSGRGEHVLTMDQRLRMCVLKEIVDTEDDYTKLLQFIVDVIIPDLRKCAGDENVSSVSEDTATSLFSNIGDIHRLHKSFCCALKSATEPYPYYTNRIGDIFLKHQKDFRCYAKYCTNFSNAQKLSYQLEEDEAMLKLLDEWKKQTATKTRKFVRLEGFVISPVQRLCKYSLLLRELKKFTNDSHPDATAVSEAMAMMEEVTVFVNESERRAVALQSVRDMEGAFDSWEKSGCLSKQGFMTKRSGSSKSWNIRWFILSGYKMSYYEEPTDMKPLGVMDLTSYKSLEEDASQTGRPFCFGITFPDKTYHMYCVNEREKQEWMKILTWKFSCIDRSRRQTHRPLETVIFASLSSFLNPKNQRIEFKDENPLSEQAEGAENVTLSPVKISKKRTKSFLGISFRSKGNANTRASVS